MADTQSLTSKGNPFCCMGRIVEGQYYIPRTTLAKLLDSRLLIQDAVGGNIAVVGLPRSGKSTCVYNEIILREKEYVAKKKVPMWFELASHVPVSDNGSGFFSSLVRKCSRVLEDNDLLDKKVDAQANRVENAGSNWESVRSESERFFELVRRSGYSVVAVIDEFDAARKLFESNSSCLRAFRDLCSFPQFGFTCVTTSRRYLRDIEAQAHGGQSTLACVFHEFCLPLYSEDELCVFWHRLGSCIDSVVQARVQEYCGRYPFLLDALGFQIWQKGGSDLHTCFKAAQIDFLNCFDAILNVLDETGLYSKLVEVLFGPIVSLRNEDVSRLETINLIHYSSNNSVWESFSKVFEEYLSFRYRERDTDSQLWPEYSRCIKTVRDMVTDVLRKPSLSWEDQLLNSQYPKLQELVAECERKRAKEVDHFGTARHIPLKDYLDLPEVSTIINTLWESYFQGVLGLVGITKKKWNGYVEGIIAIRNPNCHVRSHASSKADLEIATGYCTKLQELCEVYFRDARK